MEALLHYHGTVFGSFHDKKKGRIIPPPRARCVFHLCNHQLCALARTRRCSRRKLGNKCRADLLYDSPTPNCSGRQGTYVVPSRATDLTKGSSTCGTTYVCCAVVREYVCRPQIMAETRVKASIQTPSNFDILVTTDGLFTPNNQTYHSIILFLAVPEPFMIGRPF